MAAAHGQIGAFHRVVGKLSRQPFMRRVALGDHQQAGRVLVDPVDDAGPRDPADAGKLAAALGNDAATR